MEIALLTIWHEKNYGAELQAYATVKILHQLGHSVKMVNIYLSDMNVKSFKGKLADAIAQFTPETYKYNHFWRLNIPTTQRYTTLRQLKENPPIADVYMVGSDQVWNPDITKEFAHLFFLDFGGTTVRKVSFASSFGQEEWTHDSLTDDVRKLLSKFDSVSCRESSGVELLHEKFGVEATCVLDPTLLFSDYSELTGILHQKNTLVYYPLSEDHELESYASSLAARLKLRAINNKNNRAILNKIPWNRVGVEQWVKNIAESKFVITRSFHGMVFSILYRKNFAVLASRNGRGNRIECLLYKLGLEDRLYNTISDIDSSKPWENDISYDEVFTILNKERNSTISFLRKALSSSS